MEKKRTVIVNTWGILYKCSRKQYREWLARCASGDTCDPPGKILGSITLDATNLTQDGAAERLESERE